MLRQSVNNQTDSLNEGQRCTSSLMQYNDLHKVVLKSTTNPASIETVKQTKIIDFKKIKPVHSNFFYGSSQENASVMFRRSNLTKATNGKDLAQDKDPKRKCVNSTEFEVNKSKYTIPVRN